MKKRNVLVTSLAVLLAVAVLAGGTYTYLTGETEEVTNTFDTNGNGVELEETTGSTYDIVPGTSQEKDPTVTATYTLDSYVFIEVTDATDDLVDYYIENGWVLLFENENEDGSTAYIYYQLLEYDEYDAVDGICTTELHVLKGDKVYYSASLTNEDLENAEDISLTFQAYIIQAQLEGTTGEGYADPTTAYYVATTGSSYYDENATYVAIEATDETSLAEALTTALANATAETTTIIVLPEEADVSVSASTLASAITGSAVIDLNDGSLTVTADSGTVTMTNGDDLTIANGTVTAYNPTSTTAAAFNIKTGASMTLENVTLTTDGSALYPQGNAAEVNVINSTIITSGAYCVATNAAKVDNYDVVINIENSTLTASSDSGDNCAVLINIPGTLNISNSTITGDRQGVIVRGGTADIADSAITTTGKFVTNDASTNTTRLGGTWSSGNEVPAAALEVGNYQSNAYTYDSTVTLSGVTLTVQSNTDVVPAIYAASCGYTTALTGASTEDTVLARVSTGTASINGTSITTMDTMTTVSSLSASN